MGNYINTENGRKCHEPNGGSWWTSIWFIRSPWTTTKGNHVLVTAYLSNLLNLAVNYKIAAKFNCHQIVPNSYQISFILQTKFVFLKYVLSNRFENLQPQTVSFENWDLQVHKVTDVKRDLPLRKVINK